MTRVLENTTSRIVAFPWPSTLSRDVNRKRGGNVLNLPDSVLEKLVRKTLDSDSVLPSLDGDLQNPCDLCLARVETDARYLCVRKGVKIKFVDHGC